MNSNTITIGTVQTSLRITLFHINTKNTLKLDRQPRKCRIIDPKHNKYKYQQYISSQYPGSQIRVSTVPKTQDSTFTINYYAQNSFRRSNYDSRLTYT